ncbi:hypothetical protein PMIN01_01681 [Paraphaeosphaeria minitans]|uniref:RING-type domain-containing protein n=1 Tax=Paraphaeosphaeria minitans TaxID=565426 RepID=A0A9P6GNR0_9PLEO|nr:hypothetical protein PMIN01_01681 [Paraphaeosphaeria minitans]
MYSSTWIEHDIPALSAFYEHEIRSTPKPGDACCPICLCHYDGDEDVVYIPCKHTFHRQCIVTWFKSQLFAQISARGPDEQIRGSCPCCRRVLFDATGLSASHIFANTWVQTLYGLEGTIFQNAGRSALRRITAEANGELTLALVEDIVHKMIDQHRDYRNIAMSLGVLKQAYTSLSVPVAVHQYQVNVATADYAYANHAIRGDIASLRITVIQQIPDSASVYQQALEWAPVVDRIFEYWQASCYPRCNYITVPALHRVIICACLVLRAAEMGHSNTVAFAQLLARGECLMLEVQQQLDNGSLSEAHTIEYHRVLDYTDDGRAGPCCSRDPCLYWMSNTERIFWITNLRQRTRGRKLVRLNAS